VQEGSEGECRGRGSSRGRKIGKRSMQKADLERTRMGGGDVDKGVGKKRGDIGCVST